MSPDNDKKRNENLPKRRWKLRGPKAARSQETSGLPDPLSPPGRNLESRVLEVPGQFPCRVADEFYDGVTGLCGMCADICRPQHMNVNECQVKCSKYYRDRMGGSSNPTAAALTAGATFLLTSMPNTKSGPLDPSSHMAIALPDAHQSKSQGSAQYGLSGGDDGYFVTVLIITMVTSLIVIMLIALAVGSIIWYRKKSHKTPIPASPCTECNNDPMRMFSISSSSSNVLPNVGVHGHSVTRQASHEEGIKASLLLPSNVNCPVDRSGTSAPPAYSRSQSRDGVGGTSGGRGAEEIINIEEWGGDVHVPQSSLCAEHLSRPS